MLNIHSPQELGRTLSLLWLFIILNMLFRDIHEMTMASSIEEILSGHMNGNPMSEGVLLAGAFAVELLLLAFLLSSLLAPRWARLANLVLAPVGIAGTFYIIPSDPDDVFFAFVELCTFMAIIVLAWRWDTPPKSARYVGGCNAT